MKKRQLKYIFIGLATLFLGVNFRAQVSHTAFTLTSGTFAKSQIDTIYYSRPEGLSGLAFSAHFKDSMKIQVVIAKKLVGGEPLVLVTADTLAEFTGFNDTSSSAMGFQGSSGNPSSSVSAVVTLTPYCDAFMFIIKYDTTSVVKSLVTPANDSIAVLGISNPKVDYLFQQQFSN